MNKKGFTLAELLIVVAIIAVLVGISIPVFSNQLEKSRESKDLANVRSAYGALMIAAIGEDKDAIYDNKNIYNNIDNVYSVTVSLGQKVKDWQSNIEELGGVNRNDPDHWIGIPSPNGKCIISYSNSDGVKINWGAYTYLSATSWSHNGSGNGVGQTLYNRTGTAWAKHVTAVKETLDAKVNGTVSIKADPSLANYRLGFYAVDPSTNKVIYDSGELKLNVNNDIKIVNRMPGSTYNGDVKIVIQLINGDVNNPVSEDVSDKIMNLISIK